ncbi:lipopolysaccharide biosynthesis protein [Bosea sp. BE125]|nr:lipopolysaccharide biosynthesis protein [Bosea sp. BE125]
MVGAQDVFIHEHDNRGRDIAPFLAVLGSGALDGYDAVLKLHTKRSPHLLDGEIRRKLLFDKLCGNWNATCRALSAFNSAATGIVGWGQSWRATPSYWMANEVRTREIAKRMQAPDEAIRLGFFEGTMFWFRPAALASLRELDLRPEDFEPEARQLDGTLHHAVERCFTIAAWTREFTVRDLKGRAL